MELREQTNEEYLSDLKAEIERHGLRESVRDRLMEINRIVTARKRYLGVLDTMTVQEKLNEILDLIDETTRLIVGELTEAKRDEIH